MFHSRCHSERELGEKAKARLEQLIASGTARIEERGRRDKYGRTLAVLTVDGQDVAAVLIGEAGVASRCPCRTISVTPRRPLTCAG